MVAPRYSDPRDGFSDDMKSRSPECLESDMRRTRGLIDETIDELASRLRPSHLVDEALAWARHSVSKDQIAAVAGRTGRTVACRVSEHPIPSALVGIGLIWLLSEKAAGRPLSAGDLRRGVQHGAHSAGEAMVGAAEHAAGAVESVRSTAAHGLHRLSEVGSKAAHGISEVGSKAAHTIGRLGEMGSHAMHAGREKAGRAYEVSSEAYQRNPLVFGLLAIAGGLAAGMLIPDTRIERRTLGQAGQRLRKATQSVGERAVHAASGPVMQAVHAAEDKVHQKLDELDSRIEQQSGRSAGASRGHANRGGFREGSGDGSLRGGISGNPGASGGGSGERSGSNPSNPSFTAGNASDGNANLM
jgi:hypothetical protein